MIRRLLFIFTLFFVYALGVGRGMRSVKNEKLVEYRDVVKEKIVYKNMTCEPKEKIVYVDKLIKDLSCGDETENSNKVITENKIIEKRVIERKQSIAFKLTGTLGYGVKDLDVVDRNGTQYAEPIFGPTLGAEAEVLVPINNDYGFSLGAGYMDNKNTYGSAGVIFYFD